MNSIALHASQEADASISRYSLVVMNAEIGLGKVIAVPVSFLERDDPMPYASDHPFSFAIDSSMRDQFGLTAPKRRNWG